MVGNRHIMHNNVCIPRMKTHFIRSQAYVYFSMQYSMEKAAIECIISMNTALHLFLLADFSLDTRQWHFDAFQISMNQINE